MCGIAGIINLNNKPVSEKMLQKMIQSIKHRGPDDRGFFVDGSVGLGHCRLAIVDLSQAGHQPMPTSDKRYWIVFNGEVYNYLEIRKELQSLGYIFDSNTDTEVILYAYQEWGTDCLDKFDGMWAFAIYDKKKATLFCARDRYGIKPFYYHFKDGVFVFASEIKALLELDWVKGNPEPSVIYDYLVYGLENCSEQTFFNGIKQLMGGHKMIIDCSGHSQPPSAEIWYDFFDKQFAGIESVKNDKNELLRIFENSVKIRLRSDVTVGSCLSGGIDSSSVVCVANKILREYGQPRQEVFTSSFPGTTIDEKDYAARIIAATGCSGNFIYPDFKQLKENLNAIVWHQEEPFGGPGALAQWLIMKAAHQKKVTVLLDGQGGDEILLGYERYYIYYFKELFQKFRIKTLAKEFFLASINSRLNLKDLVKYTFYFGFVGLRRHIAAKRATRFLKKEFKSSFKRGDYWFARIKDIGSLQKTEIMENQLPHLLRYEDKNSMAFSIEARLPFLDCNLVEFACKLPTEKKIKNGWTKHILREAVGGIVPDDIRWRKKKIGFEVTSAEWMEKLKPDIIKRFSSDNYISQYFIDGKSIVKGVLSGKISTAFLWRAYNLELWMEKFGLKK